MTDWISVADRMPEIPAGKWNKSVDVLAVTAGGAVVAVSWVQPQYTARPTPPRWEYQNINRLLRQTVTHWMPMPAPPAAKGGE